MTIRTPTIELTKEITCADEILVLDHQKCCYWPARKILMLADVHLGKEAVFQRRGMAIPDGSGESSITNIQQVIKHYKPQQLLILGDLVSLLQSQQDSALWCHQQRC